MGNIVDDVNSNNIERESLFLLGIKPEIDSWTKGTFNTCLWKRFKKTPATFFIIKFINGCGSGSFGSTRATTTVSEVRQSKGKISL